MNSATAGDPHISADAVFATRFAISASGQNPNYLLILSPESLRVGADAEPPRFNSHGRAEKA